MAAPIKNNPFDANTHFRYFAEFVKSVQISGGTTPHMLMIVEAAKRASNFEESLWRAGCYAFVYNFASAEALWDNWTSEEVRKDVGLLEWLEQNKAGIRRRKERKCVYSAKNLATCMHSYATYMTKIENREWFNVTNADKRDWPELYQLAFDDVSKEVKYMGRYIIIRWLEVMRRLHNLPHLEMPDLRAKGGDHPRKAMALMYPEEEKILMGKDTQYELRIVDELAADLLAELKYVYNIETDYYTIQSLLCEYKQSVLSRKQYPGKSIDTALVYHDKIYEWWGTEEKAYSIMYDVRQSIFPPETLGELQGWNGVRKELGSVLVDYGYTWSDLIYDYMATEDLANPVFRGDMVIL